MEITEYEMNYDVIL